MNKQNGNTDKGDVLASVGLFSGDMATLAGLQMRLAGIDLRESMVKAMPWLIAAGIGGVLLLSGVMLVLGGLGLWLATALAWPVYGALLLTGLVALVIAGLAAFVALKMLPASFEAFRRSRDELERNLAWIKTTLAHSGRS